MGFSGAPVAPGVDAQSSLAAAAKSCGKTVAGIQTVAVKRGRRTESVGGLGKNAVRGAQWQEDGVWETVPVKECKGNTLSGLRQGGAVQW